MDILADSEGFDRREGNRKKNDAKQTQGVKPLIR